MARAAAASPGRGQGNAPTNHPSLLRALSPTPLLSGRGGRHRHQPLMLRVKAFSYHPLPALPRLLMKSSSYRLHNRCTGLSCVILGDGPNASIYRQKAMPRCQIMEPLLQPLQGKRKGGEGGKQPLREPEGTLRSDITGSFLRAQLPLGLQPEPSLNRLQTSPVTEPPSWLPGRAEGHAHPTVTPQKALCSVSRYVVS